MREGGRGMGEREEKERVGREKRKREGREAGKRRRSEKDVNENKNAEMGLLHAERDRELS